MYFLQPWNYKKGSQQRRNIWGKISNSLNDFDDLQFNATQKSVWDHYNLLEKQQKRRLREEMKASGISLEDIIQRFRSKDKEDQQQEEKADAVYHVYHHTVLLTVIQ